MKVKRLVAALILGLGAVLAVGWLMSVDLPIAWAATYNVNTTNDENDGCAVGACSLRDAIIDANGDSEADTIALGSGTYVLTQTGTGEDAAATGDLDITGGDALTITGQGPTQTIIDADGIDRVIDIRPGAGAVVISGVTIINGYTASGNGGGIFDYDADLLLVNTVISNNVAPNYGGGVYVGIGNVTLSGSQIISNSAYYGGGVCVDEGSATLSGNQISGNGAHYGGGLCVDEGSATLSGEDIVSNTASDGGGGIYVWRGSATLSGGRVVSNTADDGGGVYVSNDTAAFTQTGSSLIAYNVATGTITSYGGGVYVNGGTMVLEGGWVMSNTASGDGGGVYLYQSSAVLTQTGVSTITHNHADDDGGGAYIWSGHFALQGGRVYSNTATEGGGAYVGGSLTLDGGQVAENYASQRGGGMYVYYGDVTVSAGQVRENVAANSGGGMYVSNGDVRLEGGWVMSNTARWGGGLDIVNQNASLVQTGASTITHNHADEEGGGVHVTYGRATLEGGWIVSNTANSGGGVCVSNVDGVLTQTGSSVIVDNDASNVGGGLYVDAGSATLLGGEVRGNTANIGAGIYIWDGGIARLSGGRIVGNVANGGGGGISISDGGAILSGGEIISNSADYGGGVYVNQSTAAFTQTGVSTITHNHADVDGGGVYVNQGRALLSGGQIFSNTATSGGGVYVNHSAGVFTQTGVSTITHNYASLYGGGVCVDEGSATLEDGAIFSNTAGSRGGGVYVRSGVFNQTGSGAFIDNHADELGGGVFVSTGRATLSGGHVASNTVGIHGGGLYNENGTLTVVNATVSGNHAPSGYGGGLYTNGGTTAITYTTIASNTSAGFGRGIHQASGTVLLQNTIVAYNGAVNCNGTLTSNGYNLDDDDTCSLTATGDITDTDPLLGPLTEEDGTWIHPLRDGSPAVDAGTCLPGVATVDQRGVTRPQGDYCDVGACEWEWHKIHLPLVLRNSP